MELEDFNIEEYKKKTLAELKRPMFIEASAGTGKTYTITKIIKKLSDEKVDLGKILVVTYTEKAAGELRDRIRKECPDKDVDNAPIYTIHSFCQKTLSEFSFLANQCASLSVIDNDLIPDFLDRIIRDSLKDNSTFQNFFETAEKQSTYINNLKRDFTKAIGNYYLDSKNEEVEDIVSIDYKNFTVFEGKGLTYDDYERITNPNSIEDLFLINNFENLWEQLEANLQATKAKEFRDDILYNIEANHTFDYNYRVFQSKKMGVEIRETFDKFSALKKRYKNLLNEKNNIPTINFNSEQVKKLYMAWQQEKEKNKLQTYDDMLRNVREAVCYKDSSLKKQLQKKYEFAIIDEFQDTNQLQWDIFKNIFMEDKNHAIIVVGDPKQSIYSFQGADVNVYTKAVNSIAEHNGLAYRLSTNFRSTDRMVEGCNHLFNGFFYSRDIVFNDSKPSKTKIAATYMGQEINPIWIAGNESERTSEEDFPKLIAQKIVDWCSWENGKTRLQVFDKEKEDANGNCFEHRNVSFRDFAILLRSSSEFPEFEFALRKAGIPSMRYKDKNLFNGKECSLWISLFNAISAKDFTGHNRAILSDVLFSDFFGLKIEEVDNEKYDNPFCPERQMIIQWQKLAQNRKWAKLLEKIFADTNIEKRLSQLDKMQSLNKIRQIGNYAVDYLYKTDCSLEDACKHLQRLSNRAADAEDEGNLVEKGTDFDCVQLMTIHASKGLEFPVVFAAGGLRGKGNNNPCTYLYHDEDRNAKLGFSTYGQIVENLEANYERERIYYVAYTRASSLLVLPVYDVWDINISDSFQAKVRAEMHQFLKYNIISLYNEEDEEGEGFVEQLTDNGKKLEDLKKEVKKILEETKKAREKESGGSGKVETDLTEDAQRAASKKLTKKIPELLTHKHSYISLSCKKRDSDEMTVSGGRQDKEEKADQKESLAHFDMAENPVNYIAIPGSPSAKCQPTADAPKTFPKGKKLGIAIHEVFEKADFNTDQKSEELARLIKSCFEKQTLTIQENDPNGWLDYTANVFWKTCNARFPEITGSKASGNYFSLKEIKASDRISEAEFNMSVAATANTATGNSASSGPLKNYFNGFIDLIFKRKIDGRDVYSVLDWKSNSFEAEEYSDGAKLQEHTDHDYAIQRVLYSYSLIKWLSIFYRKNYPTDTEAQIFENHFGGIYYVYVRGCQENTCSGIYARTWKSWQELEAAFENIRKEFHIAD